MNRHLPHVYPEQKYRPLEGRMPAWVATILCALLAAVCLIGAMLL